MRKDRRSGKDRRNFNDRMQKVKTFKQHREANLSRDELAQMLGVTQDALARIDSESSWQ